MSALQTAAPDAAGEDAVSRAGYLLDPWNSPYWIRHKCPQGGGRRRAVFVYSFGPNRRRDSTAWEIRGDDLGVTIVPVGSGPAARGAGREPIG